MKQMDPSIMLPIRTIDQLDDESSDDFQNYISITPAKPAKKLKVHHRSWNNHNELKLKQASQEKQKPTAKQSLFLQQSRNRLPLQPRTIEQPAAQVQIPKPLPEMVMMKREPLEKPRQIEKPPKNIEETVARIVESIKSLRTKHVSQSVQTIDFQPPSSSQMSESTHTSVPAPHVIKKKTTIKKENPVDLSKYLKQESFGLGKQYRPLPYVGYPTGVKRKQTTNQQRQSMPDLETLRGAPQKNSLPKLQGLSPQRTTTITLNEGTPVFDKAKMAIRKQSPPTIQHPESLPEIVPLKRQSSEI